MAVCRRCNLVNVAFERFGDGDSTYFDVSIGAKVSDDDLQIRMQHRPAAFSMGEAENVTRLFSAAVSTVLRNSSALAAQADLFSKRDELPIGQWLASYPMHVDDTAHGMFMYATARLPDDQAI